MHLFIVPYSGSALKMLLFIILGVLFDLCLYINRMSTNSTGRHSSCLQLRYLDTALPAAKVLLSAWLGLA